MNADTKNFTMEVDFTMTNMRSVLHILVPNHHWMCAKVIKCTHFRQVNGDESSKVYFEKNQQTFDMLDAIQKQYMWTKDTVKQMNGIYCKNRLFCQLRIQDYGHGFLIEDAFSWILLQDKKPISLLPQLIQMWNDYEENQCMFSLDLDEKLNINDRVRIKNLVGKPVFNGHEAIIVSEQNPETGRYGV